MWATQLFGIRFAPPQKSHNAQQSAEASETWSESAPTLWPILSGAALGSARTRRRTAPHVQVHEHAHLAVTRHERPRLRERATSTLSE